ncbi:MAG: TonB-dependent receptor [Thermoflavifilum sp.]|nr:TonB-dependent receptor [Thermoflavifilum sp.]
MGKMDFTKYLWGALAFFLSTSIHAQNLGSISGKVVDQESQEPLVGVSIFLSDSLRGAISDVQGNFIIQHLPEGEKTLIFKYIGYQTKTIKNVVVRAKQNIPLYVTMHKSAAQQLNGVMITASYNRGSIHSLYVQRKESNLILDGISSDLIKKSPDKHVGEVLKRISGVAVQDNKFVVIRGLAERYNVTMMNDAVMPATEPDKNAFSFDIVPSNLIDNILIYKTASPDHPGDAAGGAIQINTKDFPSQKFIYLSIGTGYNSETTFKSFYTSRTNGKYDFLSFIDRSNGLPDVFKKVQNIYPTLNTDEKLVITKQFPNTFGGKKVNPSYPPISFQFSTGNTKIYHNGNKLGFIGAVNYSHSRQRIEAEKADYLLSKEQLYGYHDEEYIKDYHIGAMFNVGYTFKKSKISLKNFFTNELEDLFTIRTGNVFESGNNSVKIFSLNNRNTQNGLFNSILEGDHALGNNKTHINWGISYSRSYRLDPDQRILSLYQIPSDSYYTLHLSNENSPAIEDAGRVYPNLHENIYDGHLDIIKTFRAFNNPQKLKFGLVKVYRDRSFYVQALGYASELDPYGRGSTIAFNKEITPDNIFSTSNLDQYKIILANIPQNTKDYTGRVDLNAGYFMFNHQLFEKWELVWGIRVEDYHQKLISVNQPIQDYHNTDILPSANLKWLISNSTNIHLAYSRTLNRPQFRELAAFRYYDYQNNFIVSGNPNLLRSINDNVDFRIEYYPSAGEILSASLFYKSFQHPIEQTNLGNEVLSYDNANQALDYGMELEIRKKLNFIKGSDFFDNLIFYANASLVRGSVKFNMKNIKQPMEGQSPYMINGGLSYSSPQNRIFFSILYNRIGPRLRFRGVNDGLDTYEKPRDILDVQLGKRFLHDNIECKLTISDILSQPYVLYYKYTNSSNANYHADADKIISSLHKGISIYLTLNYNF